MSESATSPERLPLAPARWGTVIGPASAHHRRPIFVVLGMHRSGTSLCAHLLSALGVDMADEVYEHPSNAKGHWERREIVAFHDRILEHFNRGFYSPTHDFGLPAAWWADPWVGEVRREIASFLGERMGAAPFGFKDPRIARLLPMWHQLFGELGLEPKIVLCLRNPAQVARSLHVRDGLDADIGEARWFAYLVDCFRYTKGCDVCVLEYETWFEDPTANLAKLRAFVGPSRLDRQLDDDLLISAVIDGQLRHDDERHRQAGQPVVRSVYDLARRADSEAAARDELLGIAVHYTTFEQLQSAVQRRFEHAAALAPLVPELEAETAALKAALADREAALASEVGRAEAALAELARHRPAIEELPRLRVNAQFAAAEAVHAEVARLRAALQEAENEANRRRTDGNGAAREAEELRTALHAAEAAAREREAALDAAGREIAALRDAAMLHEQAAAALRQQVAHLRVAVQPAEAADRPTEDGAAESAAELAEQLAESIGRAEASELRARVALAENAKQRRLVTELARQRNAMQRAALAAVPGAAGTELETNADRAAADEPAVALPMIPAAGEEGGWAWRAIQRARRRRVGPAIRAGDSAGRSRDWAGAARHYRRALTRAPGLAPIWVQLGHALKEQGEYRDAEAAYRRSLALDASVADTHLQLGHVLKLLSRWSEAADAYARATQLDPARPDAGREIDLLWPRLVEEGDTARAAGERAAAIRFYRRALRLRPGAAAVWVRLAQVLAEQADPAAAEAAFRAALALDDRSAETHLQLAHALLRQGRRRPAIDAFAAALRLDPELTAAREGLRQLVLAPMPADDGAPADAVHLPAAGGARDVIWLGVIDWHYRIQRPQHLAANLAGTGSRVFYVSIVFDAGDDEAARFRIIDSPHPGVFEVKLAIAGGAAENLYAGLSGAAIAEAQRALDALIAALDLSAPVVVMEYPAWHEIACGIPGATIVYDYLDLTTGFSNVPEWAAGTEAAIFATADVVVAASQPLADHIAGQRSGVLIRNAADVDFFAAAFTERPVGERPVIGYFGAIADWFNIEWIEHCAAARPDWEFRLIGRTAGCDISRAELLPNVRFFGERPYRELPAFLREIDVAAIPFKMIDLIRCTNPVKLYEYMAAGKPVVAAPMPEVVAATDLAYIADNADAFVDRIAQALAEDNPALRLRRLAWARQHSWPARTRELEAAIAASLPPVSVVVLTYNNWEYTAACLSSLRSLSDYPDLEIIVVDNASTDETRDNLRRLERQDERIRVVLNDSNLGFAAGNNVGLRLARGAYVILLNNDTFVTRGWVRDLIRPMQLDPSIGLAGPLTNNIGNEQKVKAAYAGMAEMQEWARRFVRGRLRRTFATDNLAFFCVAIRRSVLDEVGLLDEVYGRGFFEDDDYCRRVRQAGYKLVIADDVFVHHHLSASFDALGDGRAEQLARNRAIFEERWGPWQPHQYRDEPGFG